MGAGTHNSVGLVTFLSDDMLSSRPLLPSVCFCSNGDLFAGTILKGAGWK